MIGLVNVAFFLQKQYFATGKQNLATDES
jgi:hypothetical protein